MYKDMRSFMISFHWKHSNMDFIDDIQRCGFWWEALGTHLVSCKMRAFIDTQAT